TRQTTGGGDTGAGKNVGAAVPETPGQTVKTIEYSYFANVAYALCEGPITRVGRIWADGKEINQSNFTVSLHRGSETQNPDGFIESKEGADNTPAYRGTAYIVFHNMPLVSFGNRLPQLNFEVFRAVDDFEASVKAVDLIPAAGEFVYDNESV